MTAQEYSEKVGFRHQWPDTFFRQYCDLKGKDAMTISIWVEGLSIYTGDPGPDSLYPPFGSSLEAHFSPSQRAEAQVWLDKNLFSGDMQETLSLWDLKVEEDRREAFLSALKKPVTTIPVRAWF